MRCLSTGPLNSHLSPRCSCKKRNGPPAEQSDKQGDVEGEFSFSARLPRLVFAFIHVHLWIHRGHDSVHDKIGSCLLYRFELGLVLSGILELAQYCRCVPYLMLEGAEGLSQVFVLDHEFHLLNQVALMLLYALDVYLYLSCGRVGRATNVICICAVQTIVVKLLTAPGPHTNSSTLVRVAGQVYDLPLAG